MSAAANRCGQIDLSWTGSVDTGGSGLWGYKIYRDSTYVQSVQAPATSATDTGLASISSHRYQVSAIDNAGNESAASSAMTATTLDCPAVSADLIGFVPDVGSAKDVVMDTRAGLAYVASGEFGLSVVDVSVPGEPQVLGASLPPFYGERVAVSGSLAVVTSNSNGMNVVDVSNPYAPVTVGAMSGIFRGAAVSGSLAYLMQTVPGNPATVDLVVVDLSVPSDPVIVGRTTIGYEANDIKIVGSLAYIAAGSNGLKIADLTSPTSPKMVGGVDTPGTATRVSVGDGYAFVADTTSLVFINISGSQPSFVTSLPISASAVAGEGGQIYALVGIQLEVINVGLPVAAPSVVGITASFSAQGIAHDGNVVLLASPQTDPSKGTGGLYLVDTSIPSAPNVLTNVYNGFDNWSVAASGSLAVVTGNSFGMRVVDVTDPKGPNSVGSLTGVMQAASMNAQYACELEVVPGNPATIDLVVIDLRSPTQPSRAGRVTISTTASDVKVVGSLAYVAAGSSGFKVVDFSNPSSPRIVGSLSLASAATKVAVANGYAYVGMGTSVAIVDVNTPSLPRLKTTLSLPVSSLAAAGTNLFVLNSSQLAVVNVTNPLSPEIAGTGPSYNAQQVAVVGNVAVLAKSAISHFDGSGGLYVIDASVPTQQQLVKHIIVPGNTRTVTADGNLIYAGDSSSLVDIVNVAQ